MKRLSFFVFFMLLVSTISAEKVKIDDLYYNLDGSAKTASVTAQSMNSSSNYSGVKTITIPSSVMYEGNSYSVTSIGSYAFGYCSSLTSLTIPNGVTSIGEWAFRDCSSLTSVTIPNGVTSIGSYAFRYCSSLTSVTIPSSVTSIGSNAFYDCVLPKDKFINNSACTSNNNWGATLADKEQDGLLIKDNVVVGCKRDIKTVTIPNGIVGIGSYAFRDCSSLTSVTIPNSVTSIGSNAFRNCSSLTSVTIPNSVTSVGSYAFYNCSSLTSVTIPSSVTSIGNSAFDNCSSLTSVTIPNSVTSIEDWAFGNCSSLTSVSIPNSVTSVGSYAFYNCSSLTSVSIPNSVTSIGDQAFYNCSSLTSVTIPNSVTSIGDYAFNGTPWWNNLPQGEHYAGKVFLKYKSVSGVTSVVIKEGTTAIYSDAFSGCSSLTSVTIPNSVTSIGNSAFSGCSSLTSVTIPNSVTSIGNSAFSSCSSLTSVTIPNSVTSIGYDAFSGCSSLASVTIPNSVTSIGSSAFSSCSSLTSVTIPSSVTNIESYAFSSCDALTSVTFGYNAMVRIDADAFAYCDNLNTIYDNTNLMEFTIGSDEHGGVAKNASYIIKDSYLGSFIFEGTGDNVYLIACTQGSPNFPSTDPYGNPYTIGSHVMRQYSLTFQEGWQTEDRCDNQGNCTTIYYDDLSAGYVDFPSTLKGLAPYAFEGTNIRNVDLHDTKITSIPESAFDNCYDIESVTLPNTLTSIGDYAFRSSRLDSITLPSSVTSIGYAAFNGAEKVSYLGDIAGWCKIRFKSYGNPLDGAKEFYIQGKKIEDLVIPNTVDSIYDYAFYNCDALTSVTIPSSVTSIGEQAFYNCSSLTSVTIPSSVTSIGRYAFGGTHVVFANPTTPPTLTSSATDFLSSDGLLFVPDACVEAYKTADYWKDIADRIYPQSLSERDLQITAHKSKSILHQTIGEQFLYPVVKLKLKGTINSYDIMIIRNKMVHLVELDLTDADIEANSYEYYTGQGSVDSILTPNAFTSCKYLQKLSLPKSLIRLQANAFPKELKHLVVNGGSIDKEACKAYSLRTLVVNNAATIGSSAFYNCDALKDVSMSSCQSIDTLAFYDCDALKAVQLSDDLQTLGGRAFESCDVLDSISLPKTLQAIGVSAFEGTALRTVIIPKSVRNIRDYAFAGTKRWSSSSTPYGSKYRYYGNIKTVKFEKGSPIKTLSRGVFAGQPISKMVFPDSVTTIGEEALTGIAIDSLVIPATVQAIEAYAFWGGKMKHISMPNSIKNIPKMAFADCESLLDFTMPTSIETISPHAFYSCQNLNQIKVSSSVRTIGEEAFADCPNVKKVYTYTLEPVSINQQTFSCWRTANLYVPNTSYYNYYYNTQWSQFLSLIEFDEKYDYFYINKDYELDNTTGVVDGKPDADLNPGSGLIVSGDSVQNVGNITTNVDSTNLSASILACIETLKADTLVIRIKTMKGKWNYFCFPMDIEFSRIKFDHRFVIREYDGERRAKEGKNGWKNVSNSGKLHKGKGYIFQGEKSGELVIRIPNPKFDCKDFRKAIKAYASLFNNDANWNFVGNPYPSYYDMDGLRDAGFVSPVYIWNGIDYEVYTPGDDVYHFHPYEGFFIQNPASTDGEMIWKEDGRETKSQADEKKNNGHKRIAMRQAQAQAKRLLVDINLVSDEYTDKTRIVFNDSTTLGYDLGHDACKMEGGTAPLHIYSIEGQVNHAINERPKGNAYVQLGYDVNQNGWYTLKATRMDVDVIIYDNVEKQQVDLSTEDYTFYTEAGVNTTRFAIISVSEKTDGTTTDIEQSNVANPLVNIYTVLGVELYQQVDPHTINLPTGVYLFESEQEVTKVLIQ